MTGGLWWRRWGTAAVVAWLLAGWPGGAGAQDTVKLEWFSWSIFRFTSPTGKVVLTNPFVTNPDSPVKVPDFPKVDLILVADGHADEVGAADEIALKTGAKIVTTFEMANVYFGPRNVPLAQILRSNPGDWNKLDSIIVRNVGSVHGSGTADKLYGGAAMGFMIHFENGLTVYFAGSTALTLDMQLWGSLYKPDVAILPLSGGRDPQDIVHMVRFLRTDNPGLKTIIPHHHRLQPPPGAPTPAAMEAALRAAGLPVTVLSPELRKVYELRK
ncbi:MAG: MBL fold metallo-hydrolase [Candidatus Rokubacteria bacterium]|nr:MBL fold metallo-hydrolase [Candidatus Rokubacteria bacterium]